jgi:dihydroflavonol-4-reductase
LSAIRSVPLNRVLVTGATSFLGYHVAKKLNEIGIRPRVLELGDAVHERLAGLNVERCAGSLDNDTSITAACDGVDTLLHLAFKVSVEGGDAILDQMRQVNVVGTQHLLDTAAAKGVRRAVVASSALAVGVNHIPSPLNETASWSDHALDLPYATIRREAEAQAIARARPGFDVIVVSPAFTLGPDDPVGAPANTLLKSLITRKLHFTLRVGFGCLDVRDFAHGVLLAAERGVSGQRYLLSGHNVTTNEFLEQAATLAGVHAPRFEPPLFLLRAVVAIVEGISKLRRKPAPISRDVLQIIGRYAWYDTTLARTVLGWEPRPLQQTLADTIQWLRDPQRSVSRTVHT